MENNIKVLINNKTLSIGDNADWLAEEGQEGYIKNKPFYSEGITEVETILDTTLTLSSSGTSPYDWYSYTPQYSGGIKDGAIYHISIGEKEFKIIAYAKGPYVLTDGDSVFQTNGPLPNNATIYISTPSYGYSGTASMYTNFNCTGEKIVITEIEELTVKLDSKFLDIVQTTGDSKTAIMSQKAVTEANVFNRGTVTNSVQMNGCTSTSQHAVAEGYSTTAEGYASHAEGDLTTAEGYASHAEGNYTTASGPHSHAEGTYTSTTTESEHASGQYNISLSSSNTFGDISNTLFTVGNGTYQTKHNAFEIRQNGDIYIPDTNAEGEYYEKPMIKLQDELDKIVFFKSENGGAYIGNCKATGECAVAEGIRSEATGSCSHTEGYFTTASAQYSHAEGSSAKASGIGSHAEGVTTEAGGFASHSEGQGTKALGYTSHAEGQNTTANAESSHAEGKRTTANGGVGCHAEGYNTTASGKYGAHAEGYYTTASGEYSHAEGKNTIAQNKGEHASGFYNISKGNNSILGSPENTLFSIGNGAELKEPDNPDEVTNITHNAFEVRQNGDIYIPDTNAEGEYYEKPMIHLQQKLKELEDTLLQRIEALEKRLEISNL